MNGHAIFRFGLWLCASKPDGVILSSRLIRVLDVAGMVGWPRRLTLFVLRAWRRSCAPSQGQVLRPIPESPGISGPSLESLQNAAFPFASAAGVHYRLINHGRSSALMIVCSCNVLSDHDVRDAVTSATDLPRSAKQLYGCLGCSAECGRCARTINGIIDEALGACARACHSGCPHSQSHRAAELPAGTEFALAAS